ncbi:MAG: hypothetical protein HC846_09090 [Blastocatellia bacterium]|nr:hypothetical protein [Blastocatellia bacterium]
MPNPAGRTRQDFSEVPAGKQNQPTRNQPAKPVTSNAPKPTSNADTKLQDLLKELEKIEPKPPEKIEPKQPEKTEIKEPVSGFTLEEKVVPFEESPEQTLPISPIPYIAVIAFLAIGVWLGRRRSLLEY